MSSSSSDKFVSPFIDGDSEGTQVLCTPSSIQQSLQNFPDSLDEDFMINETTSKPPLDDSLCMEDDTQLPTVEHSAEPLETRKDAASVHKSSPILNDSLVDDDETQLPEILQLSPTPDDSLCMEDNAQLPLEQAILPQEHSQEKSVDNQLGLDSIKLSPGATATTTSSPSSLKSTLTEELASTKVRPSFGKKKSFAPPTISSRPLPTQPSEATSNDVNRAKKVAKKPSFSNPKAKLKESAVESSPASELVGYSVNSNGAESPTQKVDTSDSKRKEDSTTDSVDTCKQIPPISEYEHPELASTKARTKPAFSIPKKPKGKLSESSSNASQPDTECNQTSDVSNKTKTTKSPTPKKGNAKKKANDKENDKTTTAKSTVKKTPAKPKATKPLDEKKVAAKEERERKRQERERVKQEKEEAKQEKERLKQEKKLEQEKKKAEREQKKMEKELKKIEKLQSKTSKKSKAEADDSTVISTNLASNTMVDLEEEVEKESTPKETLCDDHKREVVIEKEGVVEPLVEDKFSIDTDQSNLGKDIQEDEYVTLTTPMVQEKTFETVQSICKPQDIKKSKKRKQSVSHVPVAKKHKPNSEGTKTNREACPTKRTTKEKAPKSKSHPPKSSQHSKPANYSGPVWVQCEDCDKWRRLSPIQDPSLIPNCWKCTMNDDSEHAQCSTPEEEWSDLGDSQEFVESPYIPGSLVWAKMDGYPWWPAMIEEDPDDEAYYKLMGGSNPVPVKYHVVFLDTPVCRAWIYSHSVQPFVDSTDLNDEAKVNVPKKYRQSLKTATKWASKAMGESFKERLERFSFSQRFKRGNRKRKVPDEDSSKPLTHRSGARKSARIVLTKCIQASHSDKSPAEDPDTSEVKSQREDTEKNLDSSDSPPLMDRAKTLEDDALEGDAVTKPTQSLYTAEE